jgi:hypothetical protein
LCRDQCRLLVDSRLSLHHVLFFQSYHKITIMSINVKSTITRC